ncbi:hypothetical protein SNEBB_007408 [Seison nebaliae]|nr:hypothetical protein SNEBB_007408 [Seison nebaliae]
MARSQIVWNPQNIQGNVSENEEVSDGMISQRNEHRKPILSRSKSTYFAISLFAFFTGAEYAVILPTLWSYVKSLHGDGTFMGCVMAAFSLSGLFAGIIFGQWSDRTKKTKKIVLFSNIFEIVGNLLYVIGYSKWILLISRLIAGVGMGASPPVLADVSRRTTEKERTAILAIILGSRQFGLMLGPAFNFFLHRINFFIGPIHITKVNAPGIFMGILWTCMQFIIFLFYHDANHGERLGDEEVEEHEAMISTTEMNIPDNETKFQKKVKAQILYNEYLRIEIIILLAATFITYFNQTALETLLVPVTEKLLGWSETENSIAFSLAGVEILIVYAIVRVCSKYLLDRTLMSIGLIAIILSLFVCIVYLPHASLGDSNLLLVFILGVMLNVFGLPIVAVTSLSLFTKMTTKKRQGLSQGIQRGFLAVGTILGPLWSGALLNQLAFLLGGVMAAIILVQLFIFMFYKRFVPMPENASK